MAKFKNISLHASKANGEFATLKGAVNLNAEAKFYFKLDDEFLPFALKVLKEEQYQYSEDVKFDQKRSNIITKSYDDLEKILQKVVNNYALSGVKEELVIMYRIENQVTYYKMGDEIAPDDSDDLMSKTKYKNREGKWVNNSSLNRHDYFAVKVFARVVLKTTQTGSDAVKIGNPFHADTINTTDEKEYEYLTKLNAFNMGFPHEGYHSSREFNLLENVKELPYTEQRAKFFYELLMGMCKLADKFSVLEDHANVAKLADSGRSLLEAPKDKK